LDHRKYSSDKFGSLYPFIKNAYKDNPEYFNKPLPKKGDVLGLIESDRTYYFNRYKNEHPTWKYDLVQGGFAFQYKKNKLSLFIPGSTETRVAKKILNAYSKAQQKRFEKDQ